MDQIQKSCESERSYEFNICFIWFHISFKFVARDPGPGPKAEARARPGPGLPPLWDPSPGLRPQNMKIITKECRSHIKHICISCDLAVSHCFHISVHHFAKIISHLWHGAQALPPLFIWFPYTICYIIFMSFSNIFTSYSSIIYDVLLHFYTFFKNTKVAIFFINFCSRPELVDDLEFVFSPKFYFSEIYFGGPIH